MAFDDRENTLPVPENYASPEQLKSMYDYAKVLREQSVKPISHWTQGVAQMLDALVGGYMQYNANRQGNLTRMAAEKDRSNWQPGSFASSPASKSSDVGDGATPSRGLNAVGAIESGGNYAALGPVTKTGDRAHGRFQVMGANIGPWSKEALGREVTSQEFLKDPKIQDAVAQGKWNQYEGKYGPSGAARAWFAGEKGMNDPSRRDQLGTTVAGYENRFNKAYGSQPQATADQAMSFANAGGAGQAPGVEAIAQALAQSTPSATTQQAVDGANEQNNTQKANIVLSAKDKVPPAGQPMKPYPDPNSEQQPYYPSYAIPRPPQISPESFQRFMANPQIPEDQKKVVWEMYMKQNLPIQLPGSGGNWVIDPKNPQNQKFVPTPQWGDSKIDEITTKKLFIPQPDGSVIQAPTIYPQAPQQTPPPVGRGGALVPPVGPNGPSIGQGGAPPISPPAAFAAGSPAAAPVAGSADKPMQVASLGNGPIPDTAAAPIGPLTATPPPVSFSEQPNASNKLASAINNNDIPPPGIDPEMWAAHRKIQDTKVEQKDRETTVENLSKFYTKRYDDLTIAANKARDELPQLGLAEKLMNDPNYYSGFLEGGVLNWQRAKAAVGSLLGDEKMKQAGGPMELVQKIISGSILEGMKSFLQGLGQVRVAEIQLLRLANASPVNTIASNQTLIKISQIAHQRMASMHDMAANYITGEAVVDPVTGKEFAPANVRNGEIVPRNRLDVGWDKVAKRYLNEVKFITPEEEADWTKLIKAGQAAKPPEASSAGGKGDNRIQVTGPEEAAKLAPGTKYMTPDGRKYTR